MANIYFIGGPFNGIYRGNLTQRPETPEGYYYWNKTRNGVMLFVHGPSSPKLSVTQQGFFEQLPYVVRNVVQELFDKGGHPETLDIDIKPEVIFDDDGEVALVYKVSGTALEVS